MCLLHLICLLLRHVSLVGAEGPCCAEIICHYTAQMAVEFSIKRNSRSKNFLTNIIRLSTAIPTKIKQGTAGRQRHSGTIYLPSVWP